MTYVTIGGGPVDTSDLGKKFGFGTAATRDVGATSGTVAAGNDPRLEGAAQVADLGSAATKNVGVTGGVASYDTTQRASHTAAPDASYQALISDVQIGFAVLTAPRTVTLPDVDAYPAGQVLFIADESGNCAFDRPITIMVGTGTGDTIAGQPAIQITDAYQGLGFRRGAANVWIIAR